LFLVFVCFVDAFVYNLFMHPFSTLFWFVSSRSLALFFLGKRQKLLVKPKPISSRDLSLEPQDELNASTFQTYVYLVRIGKPAGPREVMRGANLTSPSVAYRNLQKLIDLSLIIKDEYGNYVVKEKVGLKGHVWIGKALVPRYLVFGLIFIGVLVAEMVILLPHLLVGASVEGGFWLMIILTVVTAAIFLTDGLRFRKSM
jgi:hypothetical protein